MKKIALAHDHLFQKGGAEKVLTIFSDIYPNSFIFTLINTPKLTNSFLEQKRIKTSFLQKIPLVNKFFKYFLILMPRAWEKISLKDYDIILSSCSAFVKGVTKGQNTKHICYCHTTTRYLWDDQEEYIDNLPEGKLSKIFLPRVLNKLQAWDYNKAQNIDYFLANSKYIARKIKKHYQKESTVIYPPIKVNQFKVSNNIKDYYLIVSRLRPYKKVDLAIEAFNNLKLPLKIIGSGTELNKLKRKAHSNIEFLGELNDEQRNYYLRHCQAFIYPQVEDFGITALEAMASGRPVIAYARGGALETVVEKKTGIFFKDQNWESLAHAILRFNSRDFNSQEIKNYSYNFDEKVFREKINNYINKI